MIVLQLISSILCFSISTLSHIIAYYNNKLHNIMFMIDRYGIAFILFMSALSMGELYFNNYYLYYYYMYLCIISSIITLICASININWKKKAYALLLQMLVSLFLFIHMIFYSLIQDNNKYNSVIINLLLMYLYLFISGIVYLNRLPEIKYPEIFDIIGHSHQIMHITTVCATQCVINILFILENN